MKLPWEITEKILLLHCNNSIRTQDFKTIQDLCQAFPMLAKIFAQQFNVEYDLYFMQYLKLYAFLIFDFLKKPREIIFRSTEICGSCFGKNFLCECWAHYKQYFIYYEMNFESIPSLPGVKVNLDYSKFCVNYDYTRISFNVDIEQGLDQGIHTITSGPLCFNEIIKILDPCKTNLDRYLQIIQKDNQTINRYNNHVRALISDRHVINFAIRD